MRRVKILVTGPFSSGKTSFISQVSEIPVLSTEKPITDETRVVKQKTTVALDFGRITIDDDLVLYIFGTPGQERFSYMWDVLSVGALGLVIMVDSTDYRSIIQSKRFLSEFLPKLNIPCVVAANKQDKPDAMNENDIAGILGVDHSIEVIPCTSKKLESVKSLLIRLFETIDEVGLVKDV